VNGLTDLFDEGIMWHFMSVSGSVNRQDPVATGPDWLVVVGRP